MLAAERGAAPLTLAAYKNDLSNLAVFLTASDVELAASDREKLHAYLASPDTVRLRPRTLARRISAMRQFYKFLLLEGVRQDDPTTELDTPRLGRPLPKILSETEIKSLIDTAQSWPGEEGIRLGCVLELLYATGLRVSELVTLPLAAARRDPRFLVISGKGGKERVVPMSEPGRVALRRYLGVPRGFPARLPAVPLAFSVARPGGPPDAPTHRPIAEGACAKGRARPGPAVAARAAPRLCQPSARPRRRPAQRAADARARRHRDDANLHACRDRAAAQAGGKRPSTGPPQMIRHFLDFERPVAELEGKIEELRRLRPPENSTSPTRSDACRAAPTGCCARPIRA